jgi:hypothetical protein
MTCLSLLYSPHDETLTFSPHNLRGPVWAISGGIKLSFLSRKIAFEGVEEYFTPSYSLTLVGRNQSTLYFFQIQSAHILTFNIDAKGLDAKWRVKFSTQKVPPLGRGFTRDAENKIANREQCVTRIRDGCMSVLEASLPLFIVFLNVRAYQVNTVPITRLEKCFVHECHFGIQRPLLHIIFHTDNTPHKFCFSFLFV